MIPAAFTERPGKGRKETSYFADNIAQEGLGRQSIRGGAFSIIGRAVLAIVQVGSVLFLARLLSPEDYGLVAMVMAVTGFAPILVDLGTRDAVVQREHITEGEVSTLFWITVTVGCSFAVLISASGPLLAWFYREPQLTSIVLVSSLTFAAAALTSQHQALLRRAVKFRELVIVEVMASVLSAAIAIMMAYHGLGFWALVTRPVAMNVFNALGVWLCCRWIPGRPAFTGGVKDMIRFGINSTGFSIADFAGKNSDRVAIGRGLGARVLGNYQNVLFIYDNLLDVLVIPLHQVAVATLSKLQNRPDELRRSWAKALSTVTFYAMPAFGVLAVTAQDVVVLLLGPKWTDAGLILSVLALRGLPHSVERTLGWLHVSAGRTDRWMRWGVFAMCIQLVALFCGLPFGPIGVAVAYVLIMFVLFVPAIAYAGRPFQIGARDVIGAVGRQLAGALISAACGFVLRYAVLPDTHGLLRTGVIGIAYLALYWMIVVGLFKVRTPLLIIGSLVRDFLPGRFSRLSTERL